ncbi:MAG: methionyl-tRNA formyltransferase [Fibrobacterales bacterium]
MNVVFMGTPDFSVSFLNRVREAGHTVSAVVTQPDRPKGRGRKLQAPPVKEAALELNIPVMQPESLKDDQFCAELSALKPDLFVVVAFSILPQKVLAIPTQGSINVHGSLLPKYRGAAPVQWAVANGDTESGVTVFLLDEKMDHGPVLEVKKCPIAIEDTAETLFEKIMHIGCDALDSALHKIDTGDYTPLEQNHEKATSARKLKKEDGLIDWTAPTATIYNLIRGFFPYPVCYSYLEGKTFRIRTARLVPDIVSQGTAGLLFFNSEKELFVNTSDGVLQIIELQLEGKKAMGVVDFYNGLQNREGLQLLSQV